MSGTDRVNVHETLNEPVLCVDLDGTLIASDLLWESLVAAIRQRPLTLLLIPVWLLRGKAYLKQQLAQASVLDVTVLPYREEVVSWVRAEFSRGRQVVLATAADARLASAVADHLGVFTSVMASDGIRNLKGPAKAAALVDTFGAQRFDYIGDSPADIPVWNSAATALLAGRARIKGVSNLQAVSGAPAATASYGRSILKALRPHQWVKNLLVFVPAIAAHRFDPVTVRDVLLAFLALSLCASGGYVLNDLLDVAADRRHPRKRYRPFASGRLSIGTGIGLLAVSWAIGFGISAALLPLTFTAIVATYLVATASYSTVVKRIAVLDVMVLAGLYVVRVMAGGIATSIAVSSWLLAFTLFVSLSLAFLKRFIEVRAAAAADATFIPGRGYRADDAAWLHSAGLSSAYLGVLVMALYANSPDVTRLYAQPERLLLTCPVVLYWATRTWLLAHRGELHDDPVVAVAFDPATYVVLGLAAVTVILSI